MKGVLSNPATAAAPPEPAMEDGMQQQAIVDIAEGHPVKKDFSSLATSAASPPRTPLQKHEESIMTSVLERIKTKQGVMSKSTPVVARSPSLQNERTGRATVISFRTAVIAALLACVLLASVALFVSLIVFTQKIKTDSERSCAKAVRELNQWNVNLTTSNSDSQLNRIISDVQNELRQDFIEIASESVLAMKAVGFAHSKSSSHECEGRGLNTSSGLQYIQNFAWALISRTLEQNYKGEDELRLYAYMGLETGAFAGASGACLGRNSFGPNCTTLRYVAEHGNTTLVIFNVNPVGSAQSINQVVHGFNTTTRPWYTQQRNAVASNPHPPYRKMWSEVYLFPDNVRGVTVSYPLVFPCQNSRGSQQHCFTGVAASDVSLSAASLACTKAWSKATDALGGAPNFVNVDRSNSSMFIVDGSSKRMGQSGILIGQSNACAYCQGALTVAVQSNHTLIRATAMMIEIHRHRQTRACMPSSVSCTKVFRFAYVLRNALQDNSLIPCDGVTRISNAIGIQACVFDPSLQQCDVCIQAAYSFLDLDNDTSWIVAVALPGGQLSKHSIMINRKVAEELKNIEEKNAKTLQDANIAGVVIFIVVTLVALATGLALGIGISRRLKALSSLMHRLNDLNVIQELVDAANAIPSSRIVEVFELQNSFARLTTAIQIFSRFIPESAVRNIVRGDAKLSRLYVKRKVVTILFSDIKNFTTISESISQADLLYLLTRYLTTMTRIVQAFEGVVGEVLGDGLLCFWGTPDNVDQHAAKACLAALAQQHALHELNQEYESAGLPKIAIRIGMHTGSVLTGNIGSEEKMKFGCMGDPVNLASRLEGMCKVYGVGVAISGDTLRALPDGIFSCRKLDLVQVKGKTKPTEIYQVVALSDFLSAEGVLGESLLKESARRLMLELSLVAEAELELTLEWENALGAYQNACFRESLRLARAILQTWPDNLAAAGLAKRSLRYLSEDSYDASCTLSKEALGSWTGVEKMEEK